MTLLPAYNFLVTMATTYSTYRLGAVASLNFLAIENMTPHFWPMSCLLRHSGWMDQDITWYGGTPRPRRHRVRWGPQKGHIPNFRPMSVVAKHLDGSRCHLVRSIVLDQGTAAPLLPLFGRCLLWSIGRPSQQLQRSSVKLVGVV